MNVGEVHFLTSEQNKPLTKIAVPNGDGIVLASIGKRKWRVRADLPYLLCRSSFHNGHRLTPVTEFPVQKVKGNYYLRTWCKRCVTIYSRINKTGTTNGYVPTYKLRSHLKKIIEAYGGPRPAAQEIGVSPSNIYRWLGDYSYGTQKFVTHKSAVRILEAAYKIKKEGGPKSPLSPTSPTFRVKPNVST